MIFISMKLNFFVYEHLLNTNRSYENEILRMALFYLNRIYINMIFILRSNKLMADDIFVTFFGRGCAI